MEVLPGEGTGAIGGIVTCAGEMNDMQNRGMCARKLMIVHLVILTNRSNFSSYFSKVYTNHRVQSIVPNAMYALRDMIITVHGWALALEKRILHPFSCST